MSKAQDQLAEDSRSQQCFGSWDFRTSKGFGTAEPDDVFVLEGFIEASLMWPDRLRVLRFGAERAQGSEGRISRRGLCRILKGAWASIVMFSVAEPWYRLVFDS